MKCRYCKKPAVKNGVCSMHYKKIKLSIKKRKAEQAAKPYTKHSGKHQNADYKDMVIDELNKSYNYPDNW